MKGIMLSTRISLPPGYSSIARRNPATPPISVANRLLTSACVTVKTRLLWIYGLESTAATADKGSPRKRSMRPLRAG